MRIPALASLALLSLAACGSEPAPVENATLAAEDAAGLGGNMVELPAGEGTASASQDAVAQADQWIGDWRGPEGLTLAVARGEAPGTYTLDMQYTLDDRGTFTGRAVDGGIAFTRPDGEQLLRAGDGAATGMKWLADKQDCLVVRQGEGYCRD